MQGFFDLLPELLNGHGYVSMFLGGLLFSFGFTTPFALAIFIEMADFVDPFAGAVIAGFGAMCSDLLIFRWLRFSFMDEIHRLKGTILMRWIHKKMHHDSVPEQIRRYVSWSVAGIIIASPLPDELGVSLLSSVDEVKDRPFALFCFLMDTTGVLIVLLTTQSLIS
jgi:hypothetical protein